MIMKLLLVVGVIAVIYMMFIKKKPEVTKTKQDNNSTNEKTPTASNDMIECANCGIYCAMDDTVLSGSKYYCSEDCVGKR